MSELKLVLAERLKQMRERSRMSQAELAINVNSSNFQISRYESGTISPSVETLAGLANALNCSTDYLLGRTDEPRTGKWTEGGISPDELNLIILIRENETPRALRVLSTLVDEAERRRRDAERGYDGSKAFANIPIRVRPRHRRLPK